jgi:uncharacterized membrane protein YbaN (DUF454 family)
LENRWCGPVLRQWDETRSVPRAAKIKGYAVLLVSFGVSIAWVGSTLARGILIGVCLALMLFLRSLPETRGAAREPPA